MPKTSPSKLARANKEFPITSVSRYDLGLLGFDTKKVTDEVMKNLADLLAREFYDQMFSGKYISGSLDSAAEKLNIPGGDRKRAEKKVMVLLKQAHGEEIVR